MKAQLAALLPFDSPFPPFISAMLSAACPDETEDSSAVVHTEFLKSGSALELDPLGGFRPVYFQAPKKKSTWWYSLAAQNEALAPCAHRGCCIDCTAKAIQFE